MEEDAFASLQLPRTQELPTLCLLVVADMDLPSASALAEAALTQLPKGGTLVDGILACGPFVSHETLQPYLTNQQPSASTSTSVSTDDSHNLVLMHAKEGLVTGCLSQLESIVCRVAWLPSSKGDPLTLFSQDEERRLMPNSRNVHKRYLPLAPGLACCGLGGGAGGVGDSSHETNDEDETTTTTTMAELLDLAAPLSEQLPAKHETLRLEQSVAIFITTGAEEYKLNDKRIVLHIHAGKSAAAAQYEDGVLQPGSLKERGDYCLVHISLFDAQGEGDAALHRWQVEKVDFLQMELADERRR